MPRPVHEAFHGVTLPFGGAKGAALALVMDIFSGLFTGVAWNEAGKPGRSGRCGVKICKDDINVRVYIYIYM